MLRSRSCIRSVVGPEGEVLTLATLPDGKGRWVVRRKAQVVAAIRGGLLTMSEACEGYGLTEEELTSWQRHFDTHGLSGLRATRVQQYRRSPAALRRAAADGVAVRVSS
jgi:hypothetical protein